MMSALFQLVLWAKTGFNGKTMNRSEIITALLDLSNKLLINKSLRPIFMRNPGHRHFCPHPVINNVPSTPENQLNAHPKYSTGLLLRGLPVLPATLLISQIRSAMLLLGIGLQPSAFHSRTHTGGLTKCHLCSVE